MAEQYDLTVIGGGPGGYVAAIRAAQLGLSVALVERAELGGVCLNRGCIPTKALLASARLFESVGRGDQFGVTVAGATPDVPAMHRRKDAVVARLRSGVETLLAKRGVAVYVGEGTIVEPGRVDVRGADGAATLKSRSVVVATGSTALVPAAFPYDGQVVLTSREALAATELPDSILVIGAGAVGCEFACFYSALGVRVTLVEMLPEVLPGDDPSAGRVLRAVFRRRGVDVRVGTKVEAIEVRGRRAATSLADGDVVETAAVLLAMGRRPSVDAGGLGELGVVTEGGAVKVDDRMATSVEGVYAIGDLVGGWLLAHVASREGIVAASQAAGRDVRMDYRSVPRCTFTWPEVASVGMTEDQASACGRRVKVGRFPFAASGKAAAEGEATGFVKILAEESTGVVVGGVVVGPHASDLIHELGLAIEVGVPVDRLANMIHAHPSLAEAVMEAAEAVDGMSVHTV